MFHLMKRNNLSKLLPLHPLPLYQQILPLHQQILKIIYNQITLIKALNQTLL